MTRILANDWLAQLRDAWDTDYGSVSDILRPTEAPLIAPHLGERFLRFSTGGWSENEHALSEARERDYIAWGMTWRLSTSGGLHIFRWML